MTPNYHSPVSPVPIELNEDQNQQLFSLKSQASSSSSSISCPIFFNPTQEQGRCYHRESQQLQHQEEVIVSHGGSCDHPMIRNESDSGLKFSIYKKEDRNENQSEYSSIKWMSSKMRLMKKMMNTDHADIPSNSMPKFENQKQLSSSLETDNGSSTSYNNNNNNAIGVCADCNTTKTPLWRSGPRGPKSLCNACGIRQRKARRAMAAAVAAANGTVLEVNKPSMKSKVQHKEKKSSNGCVPHFKKRCKLTSQPRGRKKLCFKDLMIILSKNLAYQRVFPQDEKEAAILLMALSYGHVCG